jgi:prepilin-type N-terminal cleavage/methylation domain-containing protein
VNPRGFTLIEVTVALIVGGMALSAAAALLHGLGQRAEAITVAGARVDRDANAERLVRATWGNLRPGSDGTPTVSGDSSEVRFQSWCQTVEEWLQPCRVRLGITYTESSWQLRLERGSEVTALWSGQSGFARIRYLRDAARGGSWVAAWSDLVAPPAIALILGSDTLVLRAW